jgi:histidine ammonia-lyase
MSPILTLQPGELTFRSIEQAIEDSALTLQLAESASQAIQASQRTVDNILQQSKTVYGINTGFGALAQTKISADQLVELQQRIVLSHAVGVGDYLADEVVRCILLLKINSLARGYSGVRMQTIQALLQLFNAQIYPCIPAKGSVGASGDLAPLAHLSCVLLGEGQVRYQQQILPAVQGLEIAKLSPLQLAPKEGLALLNGTQVSTALALHALQRLHKVFDAAMIAGSLSVEAAKGSYTPFHASLQQVRGHASQIEVAKRYRQLLQHSEINASHVDCDKVQDPYSLRCQPQVMGACLAQMQFAEQVLVTEANAVSDNPIVFSDTAQILSGGNFHAEPVAMAADNLALAIAEIGAMAERRIALLIDPQFSQLPAFLVQDSGLNSGFMMAQVTAASLASENKSLAHPASVDSIPTSENQEDHVSMATFAARRLHEMLENTSNIVAIELLAAAQGIDLRQPLKPAQPLQKFHHKIRQCVAFYQQDRSLAADIQQVKQMIDEGEFRV